MGKLEEEEESRSSTPIKGLPKPLFNIEPQSFSTKKERRTPLFRAPPRPPAKTCPPVSRVFSNRPEFFRAQSITFLASPDGSLTGTPLHSNNLYDENKKLSYFEQAFEIKEKIGAGFFGTVYKVRSKKDGLEYAVKIAQEPYRGQSDRARKLEEVRKHQFLLPHSNCVHFYQSWEENGRLYQQFELCEKSLQEFSEENHEIPESLIWEYLVDLLLAVQHLHDHDLIHMDIKPENIFIGRDGICKLGDFGIVIDLAQKDSSSAVEGDPKYLAMEVLERNYSKAADIFALGATMLELACDLDLPKQGPLWHQLRNTGPDPSVTARISTDLRRVIQLMMIKDPYRRPTVEQLLHLPFVQNALRKRRRKLRLITFLTYLRTILEPFSRLLKSVFLLLCVPFFMLQNYIEKTSWYNNFQRYETPSPPAPTFLNNPSNGAFSSDEDDMDYSHLSSSTHSSLASPIQDDFDSVHPASTSPLKSKQSPLLPFKNNYNILRAQSTPGNVRFRSRYLARTSPVTGVSPQKRLNFDPYAGPPSSDHKYDSKVRVSECEDEDFVDNEISFKVKPVVLADKFDCLTDSD